MAELYHVQGTVNNYPVNFIVDSGATTSLLSAVTTIKSGIADATGNILYKNIKRFDQFNTAGGVVKNPIVSVSTTVKGSAPFIMEFGVNVELPGDLLSISDLQKFFNVTFSGGEMQLTPVSRPFKKIQVKKSRLGWSSGWV